MSQQYKVYKPTPTKFKDGANLLFCGLIIANTYASSMRRRVSYRFQIDSSYKCGRAKIFFEDGEKKVAFSTNTDTCGRGLSFTTMKFLHETQL